MKIWNRPLFIIEIILSIVIIAFIASIVWIYRFPFKYHGYILYIGVFGLHALFAWLFIQHRRFHFHPFVPAYQYKWKTKSKFSLLSSNIKEAGTGQYYSLWPFYLGLIVTLCLLGLYFLHVMGLSMKLLWISLVLPAFLYGLIFFISGFRLSRDLLLFFWLRIVKGREKPIFGILWGVVTWGNLNRERVFYKETHESTQTVTDGQGGTYQRLVIKTIARWYDKYKTDDRIFIETKLGTLKLKTPQIKWFSLVRKYHENWQEEIITPGTRVVMVGRFFRENDELRAAPYPCKFLPLFGAKKSILPAVLQPIWLLFKHLGFMILMFLLSYASFKTSLTNPSLLWYTSSLNVSYVKNSPIKKGEVCGIQVGIIPKTMSLKRKKNSRCYLKLFCNELPIVSGFDAGGFNCKLKFDKDLSNLVQIRGMDSSATDGDPAWHFYKNSLSVTVKTHGKVKGKSKKYNIFGPVSKYRFTDWYEIFWDEFQRKIF
jgi:hypothetical protein